MCFNFYAENFLTGIVFLGPCAVLCQAASVVSDSL